MIYELLKAVGEELSAADWLRLYLMIFSFPFPKLGQCEWFQGGSSLGSGWIYINIQIKLESEWIGTCIWIFRWSWSQDEYSDGVGARMKIQMELGSGWIFRWSWGQDEYSDGVGVRMNIQIYCSWGQDEYSDWAGVRMNIQIYLGSGWIFRWSFNIVNIVIQTNIVNASSIAYLPSQCRETIPLINVLSIFVRNTRQSL